MFNSEDLDLNNDNGNNMNDIYCGWHNLSEEEYMYEMQIEQELRELYEYLTLRNSGCNTKNHL